MTLFDSRQTQHPTFPWETTELDEDIDGLHAAEIDRIAREIARNRTERIEIPPIIIPLTNGDINWVFDKLEPILREHAYQRC